MHRRGLDRHADQHAGQDAGEAVGGHRPEDVTEAGTGHFLEGFAHHLHAVHEQGDASN